MDAAALRVQEAEDTPYEPPAGPPEGTWLTRAKAARAMGVSRCTLARHAKQGTIVSRVENGIRLFAVGAGAAKALISAKEKASEGRAELAIVQAFAEGVSVPQIITELGCSPRIVARTLKDLQTALALAREIYSDERAAAEEQRIREIETGHPDIPTTWAWCDFLFSDPVNVTYADAKKKYDEWIGAGGSLDDVSPFVRQAIESPATWLVARRVWLGEVQRAADRRAREVVAEQHRMKMIAAKEEEQELRKSIASQRRTAALVRMAGGKQNARRSTRSTERPIANRNEKTDDPPPMEGSE